jgi:hypothetical protein
MEWNAVKLFHLCPDGNIQFPFTGEEAAVAAMISWDEVPDRMSIYRFAALGGGGSKSMSDVALIR